MRKYTNKIIELVDDGIVDRDTLIRDLLLWMSESDVEEFYDRELSFLMKKRMKLMGMMSNVPGTTPLRS